MARGRQEGLVRRMATKRGTSVGAKSRIRGGVIVAKPYHLLEDCIEGGIKGGIRRVFKYRDKDTITENELLEEQRVDEILNYIMVEICERFDFPETGDEG